MPNKPDIFDSTPSALVEKMKYDSRHESIEKSISSINKDIIRVEKDISSCRVDISTVKTDRISSITIIISVLLPTLLAIIGCFAYFSTILDKSEKTISEKVDMRIESVKKDILRIEERVNSKIKGESDE